MKKYDNIIWDWNGTLIDDVEASLDAVNDLLTRKNMSHINIEQYYEYVDTPIIKFYEHLFDVNTLDFDEVASDFDRDYDSHLKSDPIMENAKTVLKEFLRRGKNQVIISAAYKGKVEDLSEKYGVREYITDIVARDDYFAGDKVAIAKKFVTQSGFDPKKTIVIGDTLHDLQMAKAIGCDCVLTTKGHQGKKILAKTDALIIDDLAQLLKIIE